MTKGNYGIIDYFYDDIGEFKNLDDVEKEIDALASSDPHNRWKTFKKANPDWQKRISPKGRTIQSTIENYNEIYKYKVMSQIDSAKSVDDLKRINIDSSYEPSTVSELNNLINSKYDDVGLGTSSIFNQIDSAKSLDDLPDLSNREIRQAYGVNAEKVLDAIRIKTREFESLEQSSIRTFTDKIKSANTIDELPSISEIKSGTPTTVAEEKILGLLNRKKETLENV
jgi:hypothetical protein